MRQFALAHIAAALAARERGRPRAALRPAAWVAWVLLSGYSLLALFPPDAAALEVRISSTKYEYVVHEPVKLIVDFVNPSDSVEYLPELRFLDYNMEFMRYRVVTADGATQIRRFQYWYMDYFIPLGYVGEPLGPRSQLRIYMYPNASYPIGEPTLFGPTFPEPGTYELSVILDPPGVLEGAEPVESNTITFVFSAASEVEEELLDALWVDGGQTLSVGDNFIICHYSASTLRELLARYPDEEMARYVRFALGKRLASTLQPEESREALEVLNQLRKTAPSFRRDEVTQWMGTSYFYAGEPEAALELLRSELSISPHLEHMIPFIRILKRAETGGDFQEYTRSMGQWHADRMNGRVRNVRIDGTDEAPQAEATRNLER